MEIKENITLQQNDEVNVTCLARSRPLPHFTWFVSGRQIHDNYTITTFDETGPSGTSTLTYTGNRTDNAERLYCVAKSGEKQEESSGIFLSITYPPDINVYPNGIPLEGIQKYNISCLILDSNPSVNNFMWYINSQLVSEQTSNILTIGYLNRTDTNNYTCNATNGIGDPTIDFVFLDVLYKGSILTFNTTNTSMTEGQTYTAYVYVEGKPLPNVTWTRDRTDAILLTENDVTNSSLNMTSMCEDTGNYTVSVDNGLIQPDIRYIRLSVFCSPRKDQNTNSPDDISIQAGGMLTLETKIVAFPQPNITWYFRSNSSQTNGIIIPDNNFQISDISNDAIHLLTLNIEKTNSSHSGQYTVIVHNSMGQHNTSFSVNIIEPHSESSVKVEAIVAGVIGAVVFIILAACVVNCYRKKKKTEKQRKRSWRSSSKDIDDIIKENPIEDFGPIEPDYTSNAMYYKSQPSIHSIETGQNTNKIYTEVVKQTTRQQPEVVIADSDANTKL
ncbi:hemicentin-2-like [Mytilus californianus]|uniref:hemicentin-2-like n=1 Tax=Mytilus californianus TaxID=6549 RepID=UPI002247EE6D|nr:hemicentin-2-like [Mytilus californianus]